ncbi:MAG: MAPEG family protein [Thalassospira sp.]|uniref:MAPEG family protein n=1 Tax=Thalassospira sp. TaxID=1912094 RepID=UPI0032EDB9F6
MLPIPVTICTIAVFAIMLTGLSLAVSFRRRDLNLAIGDGDDRILRRRIRTHGNFIENAPLCALVVLALESLLATSGMVALVAGLLIGARILHVLGTFQRMRKHLVAPAMIIQHLTLLITAVWLLIQTFGNVLASLSL